MTALALVFIGTKAPTPCRHHGEHILTVQDRANEILLAGPEGPVTEMSVKFRGEIDHRTP